MRIEVLMQKRAGISHPDKPIHFYLMRQTKKTYSIQLDFGVYDFVFASRFKFPLYLIFHNLYGDIPPIKLHIFITHTYRQFIHKCLIHNKLVERLRICAHNQHEMLSFFVCIFHKQNYLFGNIKTPLI